jgi:hypothetical protein
MRGVTYLVDTKIAYEFYLLTHYDSFTTKFEFALLFISLLLVVDCNLLQDDI